MKKSVSIEPIKWTASFTLEEKQALITDKCILIDQKYVLVDPLPVNGNAWQYRRVKTYLSLPVEERFSFIEMPVTELGNYEGPNHLVLNQKYIAFLLQRIPKSLLRFGVTGGREDPVWILRGDESIGLLMPFRKTPAFDQKLIEQAEAGDAFCQFHLGRYYQTGRDGVARDYAEANKWLQKAVDQGDAQAHLCLGFSYLFGDCVEVDLPKSYELSERAFDLGCKEAIPWRNRLIHAIPSEQYRAISTKIAVEHCQGV